MRKFVFAVLLFAICTGPSCIKRNSPCEASYDPCARTAPASEVQQIEAYLTNNGLTATKHCSGVFYNITNPGTGASPNNCSQIKVSYVGTLTNGTEFDRSTQDATFILFELIDSWKVVLPLVKAGGSLKLYVPPSFGYGSTAVGSIPANSILIFDIQLKEVK
jgi:FKBP-type peptidyl-prolyl cis-trans isomerase FkpA